MKKLIYSKICALCKGKNISVAALERELNIGNGTIGRWGKTSPTVDKLKKVADFFGVTVDDLISEKNA